MSEHTAERDAVTYAKPLLWDAPLYVRVKAIAHVTAIRFRCALTGCEWVSNRPTRCATVTSCRNCGQFIGWQVDRSDPERDCLWYRPSMRVAPPNEGEVTA